MSNVFVSYWVVPMTSSCVINKNMWCPGSTKRSLDSTTMALHTAFGTTGLLAIFTEFKNAISKKISVANPTPNIMEMNENFQWLMATTVVIPEVIQAMIFLNAMPKEYDGVAQTMLQTTEQSKLMFNYVWDTILMEHSWVLYKCRYSEPDHSGNRHTHGILPKWRTQVCIW